MTSLKDWLRKYKNVDFEDVSPNCDSLYCLYDTITKQFGYPIASNNDDTILRVLREQVTKLKDSKFADFVLVRVGSFDRVTGMIESLDSPVVVPEYVEIVDYLNSITEGVNCGK